MEASDLDFQIMKPLNSRSHYTTKADHERYENEGAACRLTATACCQEMHACSSYIVEGSMQMPLGVYVIEGPRTRVDQPIIK